MQGTVLRIARFAVHDGPGIRTTVFLKGCPLRCAWCHSPESQSPDPEFMPLPDRCIGCGTCVASCPRHAIDPAVEPVEHEPGAARPPLRRADACRLCGTCAHVCPTGARVIAGQQMSVADVLRAAERDRIFYDESRGGVTLSGGEPLMQAPFVEALVDGLRARGIHVALDTSGFGDPAALARLRPHLFLFDVKAADEDRHRAITGVSNRVILRNLAALIHRAGPALIVRFPLVPGLTADDDNVDAVGRLVSSLGIALVDVLPYHRAGLAKYERLGRQYPLPDTQPPPAEEIARAVEILAAHGLTVRVGGA